MAVITIPRALREKLGDDATDAFVEVIREIEPDTDKIKQNLVKEVATKDDIMALKDDINALKVDNIDIRSELKLLKWMIGVVIAGVVSLIMKAFFM